MRKASFSNATFWANSRSGMWYDNRPTEGERPLNMNDYSSLVAGGIPEEAIVGAIEADARRLAGRDSDFGRRARAYRELYIGSGGNFIFPLIAAHGTTWGRWYLPVGQGFARLLNLFDFTGRPSTLRVRHFDDFIAAIRRINRDVFVECYTAYHLTRLLGSHAVVEARVPGELIAMFGEVHRASSRRAKLPIPVQRAHYEAFFRHEQEQVADHALVTAFELLDWPIMRAFCRKPWVWFAYFRYGRSMNFEDFLSVEERIAKGLVAFDVAAAQGWERIETLLLKNPLYPGGIANWWACARLLLRGTGLSEVHRHVRELRP